MDIIVTEELILKISKKYLRHFLDFDETIFDITISINKIGNEISIFIHLKTRIELSDIQKLLYTSKEFQNGFIKYFNGQLNIEPNLFVSVGELDIQDKDDRLIKSYIKNLFLVSYPDLVDIEINFEEGQKINIKLISYFQQRIGHDAIEDRNWREIIAKHLKSMFNIRIKTKDISIKEIGYLEFSDIDKALYETYLQRIYDMFSNSIGVNYYFDENTHIDIFYVNLHNKIMDSKTIKNHKLINKHLINNTDYFLNNLQHQYPELRKRNIRIIYK